MAHIQQIQYCLSIKNRFPSYFKDVLSLDVGSLDINGNNRSLFTGSLYIGVDVAEGRNVDIVSKGHELSLPDNTFDTIISTECFEHDQFYKETLSNIYRMLKPGGLFIFTCATTGRPEHGTRRTTPQDAPLLQGIGDWSDYYKNLTEEDIKEVFVVDSAFSEYSFNINNEAHDLYFYGIKSGERKIRSDYSFMLSNPKNKQDKSIWKRIFNT